MRPAGLHAQTAGTAVEMDRAQRTQVLEIIREVDRATDGQIATREPANWTLHFLKATEGMAYVPFRITLDPGVVPKGRATVYVRVAWKDRSGGERSALQRWVEAGAMVRPVPAFAGHIVSIPPGEMPVGGPALSFARATTAVQMQESFTALRLQLDQALEEIEKSRPQAKGPEKPRPRDDFVHPFEDVDFVDLGAAGGTTPALERAIAVPPGEFVMYVAIAGPAGAGPAAGSVQVYEQPLSVPGIADTFAMSSVIVADRLEARGSIVPPDRQTAFPYSFGGTDAVLSTDQEFGESENVSTLFQVLNPMPDGAGKVDVSVEYRFHRKLIDGGEEFFNETAPQIFDKDTLPIDFNLATGHDLFATQTVPLATFPPGDYRLEIRVRDRLADKVVTHDVPLTVLGSPAALLAAAPPYAPPFRKADVLDSEVVGGWLDSLAGRSDLSSPAVAAAVESARAGRFGDILVTLGASAEKSAMVPFLRGVALLALNDSVEPAAVQLRAALQQDSSLLASGFYLGACYASAGRDQEAAGAWQIALLAETRAPFVYLSAADAFLRLKQPAEAERLLREAQSQWPTDDRVNLRLAAAYAASGRDREALALVNELLARSPTNAEALFLGIRLLYKAQVERRQFESAAADAARFARYADAYERALGPHRDLVRQFQRAAAKPGA
jgi:hypothetical protein